MNARLIILAVLLAQLVGCGGSDDNDTIEDGLLGSWVSECNQSDLEESIYTVREWNFGAAQCDHEPVSVYIIRDRVMDVLQQTRKFIREGYIQSILLHLNLKPILHDD